MAYHLSNALFLENGPSAFAARPVPGHLALRYRYGSARPAGNGDLPAFPPPEKAANDRDPVVIRFAL